MPPLFGGKRWHVMYSGVSVETTGLPGWPESLNPERSLPAKVAGRPRVLVFGSRDWPLRDMIEQHMRNLYDTIGEYIVVHGACPKGADLFAAEYGALCGFTIEPHPADWNNFGRAAGFIRNKEMAQSSPDIAMGYILNQSSGSANMRSALANHSPITLVKITSLGTYSDYGFPGGV